MGVNESLGAVVKAFPQARLVAFADLSSRMILSSMGPLSTTQEYLDRLCDQARTSFDDPLFSLSVEAFGEPNAAVVMGPDTVRVFLRSDVEPADALCCICDHSIDLPAFVAKIRSTLESITHAG
ncbi:hypothetical protein [Tabrizicola sp.]|uniref:hypothetical protein n=1 Tax=Tabrizicola sp. TaxID=2005166 RepID=UPI0027328EC9|nr:hypothetical protein [Tabrizicola sp.]MDP3197508.1 hypothetical protein [Tabrizicola sp.]